MKRRKLLAAGSLGIASLAGCIYVLNQRRNNRTDDGGEIPPPESGRIEEPDYEITIPENEDEWNPHYLGQNQPNNPSIDFEKSFDGRLIDEKLNVSNMEKGNEFLIRKITDSNKMDDLIRTDENINFDSKSLLVVETGYGSSSYMHQWSRIEETESGLHLHGYLYRPINKRNDLDSNSSIIKVNKSISDNEIVDVSLTMDADFKVNFDSSEEIVRISAIF